VSVRALISKRSRQVLREYFVGTSLRTIATAFDAAEVCAAYDFEPGVGGQRRTLVEQYYRTLDFDRPHDARKFLAVAEGVLAELDALVHESPANGDYAVAARTRILSALASDGWEFDGQRFVLKASAPHLSEVAASAARLDAPELHRQLERLRASVESDPALTLGTAKELVETTCKTILEERGVFADSSWDIGRLVKEARELLGLLPANIPDSAKGSETIKRVLSNLGSIAQGLAELRNLYGTGHGHSGKRRTIEPRHARLAAGTAAVLVTFLLETHWDRAN
jgi:hypothetical protein